MGLVFSPERVATGAVPELGAQQRAGRHILDVYRHFMSDMPTFQGGMIYGSTTFGPNRRSDLDVLTVMSPDVTDEELIQLRNLFEETNATYNVYTEPNTLVLDERSTPADHQLDSMFGTHLLHTQDTRPEWAVGRPVDLIPFESVGTVSAKNHLAKDYVSHKERRFIKSRLRGDKIDYGSLQRAFELPSAVGRKAIYAIDAATIVDTAQFGRDELSRRSKELLGLAPNSSDALIAHEALVAANTYYTQLLEETLAGHHDIDEYRVWLETTYPTAVADARILSTAWKNIIAQH